MAAVLLVVNVTAFNDFTKEKQFRSLQAKLAHDHKVTVIRSGIRIQILTDRLVVGDVVHVKYGMSVAQLFQLT